MTANSPVMSASMTLKYFEFIFFKIIRASLSLSMLALSGNQRTKPHELYTSWKASAAAVAPTARDLVVHCRAAHFPAVPVPGLLGDRDSSQGFFQYGRNQASNARIKAAIASQSVTYSFHGANPVAARSVLQAPCGPLFLLLFHLLNAPNFPL